MNIYTRDLSVDGCRSPNFHIYITKFVDKVSKQIFVCSTLCQTYTFGNNLQEEVGDPSVLHCIFRNLFHAYGIL